VVEEERDVKKAMEFLNQCELLKIEDILPFFQDFVTIDHFKVRISATYIYCLGSLISIILKFYWP